MSIKAKNVTVSNKLKEGHPYFEMSKVQNLEKDMENQLSKIMTLTEKASSILKKAENNYVKGELKTKTATAKSNLLSRKSRAEAFKKDLSGKFKNDMIAYVKASQS